MKALLALSTTAVTLAFSGAAFGDTFTTDTLAPGGSSPAQGYRFVTDTLAPGGKPAPSPGYRFITDTLAPGGGTASVTAPSSDGFNWSDASIGAGVAVGGMLVLIGAALIVARRQSPLAV